MKVFTQFCAYILIFLILDFAGTSEFKDNKQGKSNSKGLDPLGPSGEFLALSWLIEAVYEIINKHLAVAENEIDGQYMIKLRDQLIFAADVQAIRDNLEYAADLFAVCKPTFDRLSDASRFNATSFEVTMLKESLANMNLTINKTYDDKLDNILASVEETSAIAKFKEAIKKLRAVQKKFNDFRSNQSHALRQLFQAECMSSTNPWYLVDWLAVLADPGTLLSEVIETIHKAQKSSRVFLVILLESMLRLSFLSQICIGDPAHLPYPTYPPDQTYTTHPAFDKRDKTRQNYFYFDKIFYVEGPIQKGINIILRADQIMRVHSMRAIIKKVAIEVTGSATIAKENLIAEKIAEQLKMTVRVVSLPVSVPVPCFWESGNTASFNGGDLGLAQNHTVIFQWVEGDFSSQCHKAKADTWLKIQGAVAGWATGLFRNNKNLPRPYNPPASAPMGIRTEANAKKVMAVLFTKLATYMLNELAMPFIYIFPEYYYDRSKLIGAFYILDKACANLKVVHNETSIIGSRDTMCPNLTCDRLCKLERWSRGDNGCYWQCPIDGMPLASYTIPQDVALIP